MTNHSTSDIPEPELFDKIEALISGFKIEEYMNLSSEHKKNLRSNYEVIKWYEPQHLPKEAIVLREDTKNFYKISIYIETDDTDGEPKVKGTLSELTLREDVVKHCQGGIATHIEKCVDEKGYSLFLFDGEVYTQEELLDRLAGPYTRDSLKTALRLLKLSDKKLRPPLFYIEDDQIKFPQHYYAYKENDMQKWIVEHLKVGDGLDEIDNELLEAYITMVRQHMHQYTTLRLALGGFFVNILDLKDYKYLINLIGKSKSGKSFVIDGMNMLPFGLYPNENEPAVKLRGDSLDSAYRDQKIREAWNGPIYIEEAENRSMRRIKSTGIGVRGTASQRMKLSKAVAEIIFSGNSYVEDENYQEQEAIERRVRTVFFGDSDAIPHQVRAEGEKLMKKIKDAKKGGIIYSIIKNHKVSDLEDIYYSLLKEYGEDGALIRLAEYVMGWEPMDYDLGEKPENDDVSLFKHFIVEAWHRIKMFHQAGQDHLLTPTEKALLSRLEVEENDEGWTFQISTDGYEEIKKARGLKMNATEMARAFGNKKLNNIYFSFARGEKPPQGFKGIIKQEELESLIEELNL